MSNRPIAKAARKRKFRNRQSPHERRISAELTPHEISAESAPHQRRKPKGKPSGREHESLSQKDEERSCRLSVALVLLRSPRPIGTRWRSATSSCTRGMVGALGACPAQARFHHGDERDDGQGREAAAVTVCHARPPRDRRGHPCRPEHRRIGKRSGRRWRRERASACTSSTTIPNSSLRIPSRGTRSGARGGDLWRGSTRCGRSTTASSLLAGSSAGSIT